MKFELKENNLQQTLRLQINGSIPLLSNSLTCITRYAEQKNYIKIWTIRHLRCTHLFLRMYFSTKRLYSRYRNNRTASQQSHKFKMKTKKNSLMSLVYSSIVHKHFNIYEMFNKFLTVFLLVW